MRLFSSWVASENKKLRILGMLASLLLILVLGGSQALQGDSEKVKNINLQARRGVAVVDSLLASNQHEKAVEKAQSLYSKFSSDPHWGHQVENRLAIALLRHGDVLTALPMLENQVILRQKSARAHRNLGACLLALGRKGRALSEYQQVVDLDPTEATSRMEYGQLLMDFKMYKDAQKEILTAAALCGDCLEIQPVLARYYFAVSEPANAVQPLSRVWLETGNPVARRNLLKAYLDSGQDQAAMDLLLNDSIVNLPLDEIQQLLAAEGRLGGTENSLFLVSLLGEDNNQIDPPARTLNDPLLWGRASHNLMSGGLNSSALLAIDKAVELAPENIVYRNNRVVLLQRLNRYDEADEEWKTVLKLDPSLEGNQKP